MVWLIPFLGVTLLFAVIILWGMFIDVLEDLDDMKGIYKYYAVSLIIGYCFLGLKTVFSSL